MSSAPAIEEDRVHIMITHVGKGKGIRKGVREVGRWEGEEEEGEGKQQQQHVIETRVRKHGGEMWSPAMQRETCATRELHKTDILIYTLSSALSFPTAPLVVTCRKYKKCVATQ